MNNNLSQLNYDLLIHAGRHVPTSFSLRLAETDDLLFCEEVIRIVPGKRLVALARWRDKPVVAKLFYEANRAEQHIQQDVAGIKILLAAGIITPLVRYQGITADNKIQVLLLQRIFHSISLDELWQLEKTNPHYAGIWHALMIELATQHVLGIVQKDLHFKNFLYADEKIYTLDGRDIDRHETLLDKNTSLENLGLLFAQFGIDQEPFHAELFTTYAKARGWIVTKQDQAYLEKATQYWLKERLRQYQKKLLRDSTEFARLKHPRNFIIYARQSESPALLTVLNNPEAALTSPDAAIVKAGNTATVVKCPLDQQTIIIKRYNIKSFLHRLKRCWQPTRAVRGWKLANCMLLLGIPTAKPLACIEQRHLGLRSTSYLLMEYIEGPHAGHYFLQQDMPVEKLQIMAEKIVLIFEKLALAKMSHGDLKMTNILIHQGEPLLIDLDGMRVHTSRSNFKRYFAKDMQRFMENWQDHPKIHAVFAELLQKMVKRI